MNLEKLSAKKCINLIKTKEISVTEVTNFFISQTNLERTTGEGDSPVGENKKTSETLLSTTGHEKSCGNLGRPLSKAKYSLVTDSALVPVRER